MHRPEGLEQQMWEFVYGLLSDDEDAALHEQIVSDPEVARIYAEVKLQSEIVAVASRLDGANIDLQPLKDRDAAYLPESSEPTKNRPTPVTKSARTKSARTTSARTTKSARTTNVMRWAVSLATAVLIGFIGYSYLKPNSPIRQVALVSQQEKLNETTVQATVFGPGRLQAQPANHLAVVTKTLDGQPRSTPVSFRLYGDQDRLLFEQQARTDIYGILQIETPEELQESQVKLVVETMNGLDAGPLSYTYAVDQTELITHLTVDKPLCRPGDTLRYRSVTLSRYDLRVRDEVDVTFEIQSADGLTLPGSKNRGKTDRGVRSGEFQIPDDSPGGQYQLIARNPSVRFREATQRFTVRQFVAPRLQKRLEFARESFGPGDEVVARISIAQPDGTAVERTPLRLRAIVDNLSVVDRTVSTDESGNYEARFRLPEELAKGIGELSVTTGGQHAETVTRSIPINLDEVQIDFFPESGNMVAGVENGVYFRARNSNGKPVFLSGRILDDDDREIAEVSTIHDGRGLFRFVPEPETDYRLQIDSPANAGPDRFLPQPDSEQFVVLNTHPSVFDTGAPLAVQLRSARGPHPLTVTATCRGAVVGQRLIPVEEFELRDDGTADCTAEMAMAEKAEGVVRITAYDMQQQPARPIAERLVYRRPAKQLKVHIPERSGIRESGGPIDLTLAVQDEAGVPQPAVLGIRVVDEALLAMSHNDSPALTTSFWLTANLSDAEHLEDANFYLQLESGDALEALDLLLGTQGWRSFRGPATGMLASAQVSNGATEGDAGLSTTRVAMTAEATAPLIIADNAAAIRDLASRTLEKFQSARQTDLRRSGLAVLIGGLIVLLVALVLSLLRRADGMRQWAPHMVAGCLCLVVGIVWVSSADTPHGGVAMIPTEEFILEEADTEFSSTFDGSAAPLAYDLEREELGGEFPSAPEANALLPAAESALEEADIELPLADAADPERKAGNRSPQPGQLARELRQGTESGNREFADHPRDLASEGMEMSAMENVVAAGSQPPFPAAPMEPAVETPAPAASQPIDAPALVLDSEKQESPDQRRARVAPSQLTKAPKAMAARAQTDDDRHGKSDGAATFGMIAKEEAKQVPTADLAEAELAEAAPAENEAPADAGAPLPPIAADELLAEEPTGFGGGQETADSRGGYAGGPAADLYGGMGGGMGRSMAAADQPVIAREFAAEADVAMAAPAKKDLPIVARSYATDSFYRDLSRTENGATDATKYWNPLAIADQQGQLRLEFELPKNNATYRLSVDGHLDGCIGSAEAEIVVGDRKP